MDIDKNLLDWLLEDSDPSIRYRTLVELLDRDEEDATVVAARAAVRESEAVAAIMDKMHPEGYWLQKKSTSKEMIGDDVEYGSYATTHYALSYLAELGMDVTHAQIARAADRYLSLQKEDGDFLKNFSCLNGINLRTFTRLGLRNDPRVQKTIALMLSTERPDGGYLCDLHEGKYKTRPAKSCIRGAAKMLMAYAELPETHDHPRVQQLVDYFLRREAIFKTRDPAKPASRDVGHTRFPFTYTTSLTEVLYALSRLGLGKDSRLQRAWAMLAEKRDELGRYLLEWTAPSAIIHWGERGKASKWITFYALLAQKWAGVTAYP